MVLNADYRHPSLPPTLVAAFNPGTVTLVPMLMGNHAYSCETTCQGRRLQPIKAGEFRKSVCIVDSAGPVKIGAWCASDTECYGLAGAADTCHNLGAHALGCEAPAPSLSPITSPQNRPSSPPHQATTPTGFVSTPMAAETITYVPMAPWATSSVHARAQRPPCHGSPPWAVSQAALLHWRLRLPAK